VLKLTVVRPFLRGSRQFIAPSQIHSTMCGTDGVVATKISLDVGT
jgi:hypothetical protein